MLLEKIDEVEPDLILMVRGQRFTEEVLRKARERAIMFGWYIEAEERAEDVFGEVDLFDHYFFVSSASMDFARLRGLARISHMRHSVDTEIYYPVDVPKRYDWCFVGNCVPRRQEYIDKAMTVSMNGAIFGPRWLKKNVLNPSYHKIVKGRYIQGAALIRLYSESKVVLNVTNWGFGGGEERSGVNQRILEVPACRAALLTDGAKSLNVLVDPGKHVIVYNGIHDFAEKLSFFIRNDAKREKIAREGYRHVTSIYSYDDLRRQIVDRYNEADRLR